MAVLALAPCSSGWFPVVFPAVLLRSRARCPLFGMGSPSRGPYDL